MGQPRTPNTKNLIQTWQRISLGKEKCAVISFPTQLPSTRQDNVDKHDDTCAGLGARAKNKPYGPHTRPTRTPRRPSSHPSLAYRRLPGDPTPACHRPRCPPQCHLPEPPCPRTRRRGTRSTICRHPMYCWPSTHPRHPTQRGRNRPRHLAPARDRTRYHHRQSGRHQFRHSRRGSRGLVAAGPLVTL